MYLVKHIFPKAYVLIYIVSYKTTCVTKTNKPTIQQ
jgi:hypothetical protein